MSIVKRLRVILAALRQEWHQKKCPECQQLWWQQGQDNELFRSCPSCDAKEFDEYLERLETRFNDARRKGAF